MVTKDTGFTLIELLVVIIIMGILAAISLPSFLNQSTRAKYADVQSKMSALKTQIAACHLENGVYPADVSQNKRPECIENWYFASELPFNSPLDYNSWSVGGGCTYVGLEWFGENGRRDSTVFTATVPSGKGAAYPGDDVAFGIELICP